MNSRCILNHFLKYESPIIATWISTIVSNKVEYSFLDKKSLTSFLEDSKQIKEGILQAFVESKNVHNETIKCIWGTKICFFERCINRFNLHDDSVDLYQRGITYELEKQNRKSEPLIGNSVTSKLENLSAVICQHIQSVSQGRYLIKRMVALYKIDKFSQIWFLGLISLRMKDYQGQRKQQQLVEKVIQVSIFLSLHISKFPDYVDLARLGVKGYKNIIKDTNCIKCEKQFIGIDLLPIKMKNIIESWNFDHIGKSNVEGNKTKSKEKLIE